jgi:hypothetical protein
VNLIAVMAPLLNQLDTSISYILNILFYAFFVVFIFYGQRIQMYVMLREVEGSLFKLKYIKEEGKKIAVETLKEIGKPQSDPAARVDRFLEYFTIGPQGLDPAGIVWKLEHILDVRDARFKDEVKCTQLHLQSDKTLLLARQEDIESLRYNADTDDSAHGHA